LIYLGNGIYSFGGERIEMPGYRLPGESYEDRRKRILGCREDRKRIQRAREDKTPKTLEYIQQKHAEWLDLSNKGETGLGFPSFADITWNEYTGWESTGQWPPPRKVEICILCEKELEPTSYDTIAQPYDGSEIRIRHCYGSRYDFIGFRNPIHEPGFREHVLAVLERREPPPFEQNTPCGVLGSEPKDIPKDADRVYRLAACSHILAVLCDDCFEKKAHLFKGYEKNGDNLDLIVE
jgi:hypothetical protein